MKTLPLKFRANGFVYVQLLRTVNKAIYALPITENLTFYTVFKIPCFSDRLIYGRLKPKAESYPKAIDFGRTAWKCSNLFEAIQKFLVLGTPNT